MSFFSTTKNRRFNYLPRYYDEQKEEMEKRRKLIAQEIKEEEMTDKERVPIIRSRIHDYYQQNKRRSKKSSNIRMLVILAVLLMLFYYLFTK